MQLQILADRRLSLKTRGQPGVTRDKALYWMGSSAVDLFARTLLNMDICRQGSLPEGPKIFAANHPTTIDPFLVLTLSDERMSILVTGGAFTVPLFGRYLRHAGHVPVVKSNGRQAFDEAQRLLSTGRNIGIFPEGALSPTAGAFHRPRSGAARLALLSGAPVIPVGISLSWERVRFVPAKIDGDPAVGRLYMRGPYAMTVGEPLRFEGDVENYGLVESVSEQIMGHIAALSHQSAQRIESTMPSILVPTANPGPAAMALPAER